MYVHASGDQDNHRCCCSGVISLFPNRVSQCLDLTTWAGLAAYELSLPSQYRDCKCVPTCLASLNGFWGLLRSWGVKFSSLCKPFTNLVISKALHPVCSRLTLILSSKTGALDTETLACPLPMVGLWTKEKAGKYVRTSCVGGLTPLGSHHTICGD